MYKKTLTNNYLSIKVSTNSKRIMTLLDNFLDSGVTASLKPKISIQFNLEEHSPVKPGDSKQALYQNWIARDNTLVSSFGSTMATATVNPKKGLVDAVVSDYQASFKEATLDFIFVKPLHFILAHHGLFFIHASVVCKGSNCVLINGPQNSGKSTIALTLGRNGFGLLTDDDCFAKSFGNKARLFPFPTKMGLNDKIIKKYPEFRAHLLNDYRYGNKQRLPLNTVGNGRTGIKTLTCTTILFPAYRPKGRTRVKKISRAKALNRLARESSFLNAFYPAEQIKKIQNENFWALYNLTRNARAYELQYNDKELDNIPGMITKIF